MEIRRNSVHIDDLALQLESLLGHPINDVPADERNLYLNHTPNAEGSITYYDEEVRLNFKDEGSLAHEFLHYILALRGAKLPVLKTDETADGIGTVQQYLLKSVSHHPIITNNLLQRGYDSFIKTDDQWLYGVRDLHRIYRTNVPEYRAHLLDIIDERTRIRHVAADQILRPVLDEYALGNLYDLFRRPIPTDVEEVGYADFLSQSVIDAYGMGGVLALGDLDEYIQEKERREPK